MVIVTIISSSNDTNSKHNFNFNNTSDNNTTNANGNDIDNSTAFRLHQASHISTRHGNYCY